MISAIRMKSVNYLVIKTKKVIGRFKLETPENNWIDEFLCVRSKMYSFKSRDGSKKN